MALPIKKDIAVTRNIKSHVREGVCNALQFEIDARNKRLGDDADIEFYVETALELVTEELRKERLEHEKKGKGGGKGDKPELHAVQQSA